jgi:hypothetical protein
MSCTVNIGDIIQIKTLLLKWLVCSFESKG